MKEFIKEFKVRFQRNMMNRCRHDYWCSFHSVDSVVMDLFNTIDQLFTGGNDLTNSICH